MEQEVWETVIGFDKYEVSNLGVVRSKAYVSINKRTPNKVIQEIILRPSNDGKGYMQVVLYDAQIKPKTFKVHKLVAIHFVHNPENKKTVNHINGVKKDNRAVNLEWATPSENTKHKYAIGLDSNKGIKHPSAKLTEQQVLDIRARFASGETDRSDLGSQYGVSPGHIFQIIKKISWSHI